MTGPLSDVRILDLTWVLSGPFASMVLCDLGADVVKVERPPWGDVARTTGPHVDGESAYFFSINRGKRSIAIDLQSAEGRELFLRAVDCADVVMENFTPGTMDRLGLGWDVLHERNPRLVYAATSGFGQTGPDRLRPALDIVVQGMGGVMSITGEPGGRPVRPGLSLGDIAAGLFTAVGILAALHERERSGEGQMVDVSMLDCQIAVLEKEFVKPGDLRQHLQVREVLRKKKLFGTFRVRAGAAKALKQFCVTRIASDEIGGIRLEKILESETALFERQVA